MQYFQYYVKSTLQEIKVENNNKKVSGFSVEVFHHNPQTTAPIPSILWLTLNHSSYLL